MKPFRYSIEAWLAIEACLLALEPDADAQLRTHWRRTIEARVYGYRCGTTRSPAAAEEKARWKKLAVKAQRALDALAELEAIGTGAHFVLEHTLTDDRWNPEPEGGLAQWKAQTAAVVRNAKQSAKGVRKPANRERGSDVDWLIDDLLTFWTGCGGSVGKAPTSPSTRFVAAALGGVVPDTIKLPRAVADIARHRKDLAAEFG